MTLTSRAAPAANGYLANHVHWCEELDLPFDALLAAADPRNWPRLDALWLRMIPLGIDDAGWHRYIEHVRYRGITMRVPLRFAATVTPVSYTLNYALDTGPVNPRRIGHTVTVDEGHITVEALSPARVRVTTVKVLAFAGINSWLGSKMTPLLGYEQRARAFYRKAAELTDPIALPYRLPTDKVL